MRYLLLILLLIGCYTERKAKNQFSKAVVAYPKIPADYCADEFPVKDSLITDTLRTTDTLYVDPLPNDTVLIQDFDTVRIYITKTLPGKVITNTVYIRDTILRENTAALKAYEIDNSQLIQSLTGMTDERDKYKGQAKKRGLIIWSTFGLIFLISGLWFYLKSKKVLP